MTCVGCKWLESRKGRIQVCTRYWKDHPVRCINWRAKQGQRASK